MNKLKVRNSNLELYRIIVMLLIVAHHYVVNSGLTSIGGSISSDPTVGMYSSSLLFLHSVLSVLGVFVICSIIDMARIKFVETPFFNYFDKVYDKFTCGLTRKKCTILKS